MERSSRKPHGSSLCLPDGEKSCFACCPPIRPAGYEHAQYKSIIMRVLRENTGAFAEKGEGPHPITGFSCWALGYLDKGFRLVGCLLHPARNSGRDLRSRVDYGNKCARETCPEALTFSGLGGAERAFWLHLADGLDSFSYSSRRLNPLFGMMGWGSQVLGAIAREEGRRVFGWEDFLREYPFFATPLAPRAHAYLIRRLLAGRDTGILRSGPFVVRFEQFAGRLLERLRGHCSGLPKGEPVHLLGLERDFSDFIRLAVPLTHITTPDALVLKEAVDRELDTFRP